MKITSHLRWLTILTLTLATASIGIQSTRGEAILVPRGSVWKYLDDRRDPGTAWRAPAFDDSIWASGLAKLGFGEGDEATVIDSGVAQNDRIITAYFRHRFAVSNTAAVSNLIVRVRRDDGVILYLNGVEVYRNNMPAGPVSYTTLASAGAVDDGRDFQTGSVPPGLLLNGFNLVAAEVHQQSSISGDLSFDLELLGDGTVNTNPPPVPPVIVLQPQSQTVGAGSDVAFVVGATGTPPLSYRWRHNEVTLQVSSEPSITLHNVQSADAGIYNVVVTNVAGLAVSANAVLTVIAPSNPPPGSVTLVAAGSTWRYLDTGVDLGTAWRGNDFNLNETSWPSGPAQLGYGDGDEATVVGFGPDAANKYITTYFRRTFAVTNAGGFSNLIVRLLRDDGAVVYLNGVEVFRSNLPPGPISYTTLALSAVGGPEETTEFVSATVDPGVVRNGPNVVAVEVHQVNASSSDLSFDLELTANIGPAGIPRPVVTVTATQPNALETDPLSDRPEVPGVFTLVRSGPTTDALTVTYQLSGTASNGADYSPLSGSVQIPAGASSAQVFVNVQDDSLVEGTETVVLSVVPPVCAAIVPPPPGCYVVGTPHEATVFILDNDQSTNRLPTVEIITPTNGATATAGSNILLGANAEDPDGEIATVEFFAGPLRIGSANGPLRTPLGNWLLTWSNVVAGEYILTARATDNSGAVAVSAPVHIRVIPVGPEMRVVNVVATDPEASESGLLGAVFPGTFTFYRSGGLDTALTVYFTLGGSAGNGVDYVRLTNRVVFNPGAAETRLNVFPLTDGLAEGTETVVLTLDPLACIAIFPPPPECYLVGPSNQATVFIVDSPQGTNRSPSVRIVAPTNGQAFVAPASILIVASAEDADGFMTIQTVEFFEGNHSLGIRTNFPTLNPLGPFALSWLNVPSGEYSLTAKATDDHRATAVSEPIHIRVLSSETTNLPVVSVIATAREASEDPAFVGPVAGEGLVTNSLPGATILSNVGRFKISRDGGTNTSLTVYYSLGGTAGNGVDYGHLPDSVTIPAGARSANVVIVPIDDPIAEGDETVVLGLRPNASYRLTSSLEATVVIHDNDGIVPPAIIGAPRSQEKPAVASNGELYLVVWADQRDFNDNEWDIYGARVTSQGHVLDPNGIRICALAGIQSCPAVASDGTNFLVVWNDARDENSPSEYDIYGARVTAGGIVIETNGFPICRSLYSQFGPSVAFNGTNYLAAWYDYRNSTERPINDIYGARLSREGVVLDPDGLAICTAENMQWSPGVASLNGSFFVAWDDSRYPNNAIRGTRVTAAGGVINPDGVVLSPNYSGHPIRLAANSTGYLVVWSDPRNYETSLYNVFAHRLNPAGEVTGADIVLCNAPDMQVGPAVAASGAEFLAVWMDDRFGYTNSHIFGTRIGPSGALNPDGIRIGRSASSSSLNAPGVASLHGDYLVVWVAASPGAGLYGETDIVGARVTAGGSVLDPNAFLVSTVQPNRPPTVSIVSPANGAVFVAPAAIHIEAVTRDPDGYANSVEFFDDGQKIGETRLEFIQAPPSGEPLHLEFSWTNPPLGEHHLTAHARDDRGGFGASEPIRVTVVAGPTNSLPVVTIRAIDSFAAEDSPEQPGNEASLQVRRSGSTNSALTVQYEVSGTASNGVDYQILSGSVTIPAGGVAAAIVVRPIDDDVPEGMETIILTLLPAADYRLGEMRRAAATIVDDRRAVPISCPLCDGLFHIVLTAPAGQRCDIQASADLIAWTTIATCDAVGGQVLFIDAEAGVCPRRFYRVVLAPPLTGD